jgi:hypothetical protein
VPVRTQAHGATLRILIADIFDRRRPSGWLAIFPLLSQFILLRAAPEILYNPLRYLRRDCTYIDLG